jgi:UDP-N-acetylmuramoyl-tripeptide--D-alanyl-D-alanine ligase
MSSLLDLQNAIHAQVRTAHRARDRASVPAGPVVVDSRQVKRGDVFWALKGPNHDGADFTDEAFRRGATAAVVARPVETPDDRWVFQVADTRKALWQWAAWKRRQFTGALIAVTGSVGKSTTREMIHAVLRSRLHGTASPRNFNNHIGVPLSLTALEPRHDYAVLELGASRCSEIAALTGLCAPTFGAITRIGDAHLAGFGSRQAIAGAKAELLDALPPDGQAVLGDDRLLRAVAHRCRAKITWVGAGRDCDLRATDVQSSGGWLRFVVDGRRFNVPVWGRHHLTSALMAIAFGRMLGLEDPDIAQALEGFQGLPMRCEIIQACGATFINDTYNSNPTAMRAALSLLRECETPGRRIAVCGDMAELGKRSAALHWAAGKQIFSLGNAELLFACGQFAAEVVSGARAAGMPHARAVVCANAEAVTPRLEQAIQPGDVVLVKGSRVMSMERVVQALRQREVGMELSQFSSDENGTVSLSSVPLCSTHLEPLLAPPFPSDLRESGDTLPSLGRSNSPWDAATGSAATAGASRWSL